MDETWTIDELVTEVQRRIAALPRPQNGQVRAVPDDRTIRYYGTIGLIDRPAAMRGRTALYSRKHVAQVVAIKRLQATGKSLAEIQALWPTLDDATLSRMSGVELPAAAKAKPSKAARKEFWKADAGAAGHDGTRDTRGDMERDTRGDMERDTRAAAHHTAAAGDVQTETRLDTRDLRADAPATRGHVEVPPALAPAYATTELRVELAPNIFLSIAMGDHVAISRADVAAIRAAAAPLLSELAKRQLTLHAEQGDDV